MAIALEIIGNRNVQFYPYPPNSSTIPRIETRIKTGEPGAPQELLEVVSQVAHADPRKFSYYGDMTATIKGIQAITLLPLIDPDQAVPALMEVLESGLAGETVQEAAKVAAETLMHIPGDQVQRALPLVEKYLSALGPQLQENKLMDEDEFSLHPSDMAQALQEARTNLLWRPAGLAKDKIVSILPFLGRRSFFILQPQRSGRNMVCWDLEGPLSGQDNAFTVFQAIPGGKNIYQAISYYDDMLCGFVPGHRELQKEGYEAGDTLKLIIPHLVHHGVTEEYIRNVSAQATLVPGVEELFHQLREEGHRLRIVSTSYHQHAVSIGKRLGLAERDIHCTVLPLDHYQKLYSRDAAALIEDLEKKLAGFSPDDFGTAKDVELKRELDKFHWRNLPTTSLGQAMNRITVMGGARKAWALERAARQVGAYLEEIAFVGDSITDAQAAKAVETVRGLMVAFNGNGYVIPHATVAFASLDMLPIKPVFDAWTSDGRPGVKEWVENYTQPTGKLAPQFDWLASASSGDIERVIKTHKEYRTKMRELAAVIG